MGSPIKRPISARATASQVAHHFGVSAQHVGRLAKEGVISLGADGRYDLDASRFGYLKHLRSRRSAKSESDTEFRKLKSRELTLRIAKQAGSLIDLEECFALSDALIGSFRSGLSGLPAQIRCDVVLRGQIEKACDEMLTRLADEFQRKATALKDGQSLIEADVAAEADDEEE